MDNGDSEYRYQDGMLFLGSHPEEGYPLGVKTERHAITIAGSRSGKGVAVVIPNLLKWKHNALVVDPKGEAVNATAQARQDMGQNIHVIDPFNSCKDWTQKATFNPLDMVDVDSDSAREDILVIADGVVLRNPKIPKVIGMKEQ